MNPAFSTSQLRTFLPIFQRNVRKVRRYVIMPIPSVFNRLPLKMIDLWTAEMSATSDGRLSACVHSWLTKATLDIVGEGENGLPDDDMLYDNHDMPAAFDYSFGALDQTGSPLLNAYSNML